MKRFIIALAIIASSAIAANVVIDTDSPQYAADQIALDDLKSRLSSRLRIYFQMDPAQQALWRKNDKVLREFLRWVDKVEAQDNDIEVPLFIPGDAPCFLPDDRDGAKEAHELYEREGSAEPGPVDFRRNQFQL